MYVCMCVRMWAAFRLFDVIKKHLKSKQKDIVALKRAFFSFPPFPFEQ